MSSESRPRLRRLRLWLIALNAAVLLAALALAETGSRHAWFLAFLVPVAVAPFAYARFRLARSLERALAQGRAGAMALHAMRALGVALDGVLLAQLLTARSSEAWPVLQGPIVGWVGPVWFSAHGLLFLAYGVEGIVRGLHRIWTVLARAVERLRRRSEETRASSGFSPERRELLQRASLFGAGLPFFVSLSSVPMSYDFRVENRELELPGWPRDLDGLRIVHLSDIHVGGGMDRERLARVAALTNACKPDLVAHTGDFLTHRSGDFDAPLYEALATIVAPLGQWACLGNHDFEDPERLVRRLSAAGVTVLRDRSTRIDVAGHPLELAGADFVFDRSGRRAEYERIARAWGPRAGAARILLNHDPMSFADLPDGCADLVLSGHTHGGHVGLQLGPSSAITVVGLLGLPDQGVFSRGDMRMFVTRCVGFYGYPMRVGIPPEIALLVLRAAPPPTRAA